MLQNACAKENSKCPIPKILNFDKLFMTAVILRKKPQFSVFGHSMATELPMATIQRRLNAIGAKPTGKLGGQRLYSLADLEKVTNPNFQR